MKRIIAAIFTLAIIVSCNSNGLVGEYHCEMPNGKFGSVLRFKKGGKLFLDLVTKERALKYPEFGSKYNAAGEYEIVDDQIIIKYFDGAQTHTLTKIGDKLTSTTNIFRLCTCKTK